MFSTDMMKRFLGGGRSAPRAQSVDSDDEEKYTPVFYSRAVRHAFIRRVYMILMGLLIVTFGFVLVCVYVEEVQEFIFKHAWLVFVAIGVYLVCNIVLCCCHAVCRAPPWNYIILVLIMLSLAFLTGTIASLYVPDIVLTALGLTAGICLIITIFAFQVKWDFTVCGLGILIATIVLIVLGIVCIFVRVKWLHMVYAGVGVLINAFMLLFETQLLLGDKENSLDPDEYVYGALMLYMTIIQIFLFLLKLLGLIDD